MVGRVLTCVHRTDGSVIVIDKEQSRLYHCMVNPLVPHYQGCRRQIQSSAWRPISTHLHPLTWQHSLRDGDFSNQHGIGKVAEQDKLKKELTRFKKDSMSLDIR